MLTKDIAERIEAACDRGDRDSLGELSAAALREMLGFLDRRADAIAAVRGEVLVCLELCESRKV